MDSFRNHEHGQERKREGRSADRSHFLGQEIQQGREQQHEEDQEQSEGDFDPAHMEIKRHLEVARRAVLETEHDHRQGLEDETPDHAEGIGLAQHVHVASGERGS